MGYYFFIERNYDFALSQYNEAMDILENSDLKIQEKYDWSKFKLMKNYIDLYSHLYNYKGAFKYIEK
jgi:hypothetical protein